MRSMPLHGAFMMKRNPDVFLHIFNQESHLMTSRHAPMLLFLMALLIAACSAMIFVGCSSGDDDDDIDAATDDDAADDDTVTDDDADDDSDDDLDDDTDDDSADDDTTGDYWEPSSVVDISAHPDVRGLKVERGIIHIHSVYSHDACDNVPQPDGHLNWACLAQLREAMCSTNQQYVQLTDHDSPFSDAEFPDVLLYMADEGDELVYEEDAPIANIIHCPDGNDVIVQAGNENDLMPLHLHRMPDGTPDERRAILGAHDEAAVQTMKSLGALVTVNHSELWTTEELAALSIDGIELYNLHANLGTETEDIILTVLNALPFLFPGAEAGHSDLLLLSFFKENTTDLDHFDKLLADRRQIGVLASDVHRNSIPIPLRDGDRGDSYRRLMRWFANYILVDEHDVANIEDALARGRMYGVFQAFGEPVGFDFRADTAKGATEMGDEAALADGPVLTVDVPTFYNMDPSLPAPEFSAKIIMAGAGGGTVVADSNGETITYTVTEPGAYRAEVHVVPHHLEPWLGGHPDDYIKDYPLIYSNPIYITE